MLSHGSRRSEPASYVPDLTVLNTLMDPTVAYSSELGDSAVDVSVVEVRILVSPFA